MSTFNIGDVVILKSGGPKMTVNHVVGVEGSNALLDKAFAVQGFKKGDVNCEWFDENGSKTKAFKKEVLDLDE